MILKSFRLGCALAMAVGLLGLDAAAQPSRDRPVTVITPSAPGGSGDIIARYIQEDLGKQLGRTLIVENLPGANGAIALQRALQSDPAHPAFLVASPSETTLTPLTQKSAAYSSSDFRLIAPLSGQTMAMLVRPDFPAKDINEMIEMARRPGAKPLTLGGIGVGSIIQIAGADMSKRLGIPLLHIPYKAGTPAVQDVMSGQIDFTILPFTPTFIQSVQAGKLKAFVIFGAKKHPVLTGVPTADEVPGLKGMYYPIWQGLFVPSKVPQSTAAELNKAINAILVTPAYQKWLAERGSSVEAGMTPEQAEAFFRTESRRLETLAAEIGLQRE